MPVRRPDGAERVVKVAVGDPDDYRAERDALRHYAALPSVPGVRAAELCGWDDDLDLLELERVDGFELGEDWPDRQDDAELTAELARTMRALWASPVTAGEWRDLATWMQALDQPAAGIDAGLLAHARDLGAELRQGAGAEAVVLHGDFHHENVLREPTAVSLSSIQRAFSARAASTSGRCCGTRSARFWIIPRSCRSG